MASPIAFRFSNETIADMDMIATQCGCDRKEAVRLALAAHRATVTGLVPASTIPAPAVPGVSDIMEPAPGDADEQLEADVPPPPPRQQARPAPSFGPVKQLRDKAPEITGLSGQQRPLNPVVQARLDRQARLAGREEL